LTAATPIEIVSGSEASRRDVHKDAIAVALAEGGTAVREYRKIANTPATLNALAANVVE